MHPAKKKVTDGNISAKLTTNKMMALWRVLWHFAGTIQSSVAHNSQANWDERSRPQGNSLASSESVNSRNIYKRGSAWKLERMERGTAEGELGWRQQLGRTKVTGHNIYYSLHANCVSPGFGLLLLLFFFFCQYIFYKDGQIANRS